MLRRKLLIRIGLLVACFVIGAVVAISLFQGALVDIDRINREGMTLVESIARVDEAISRIEDTRNGLTTGGAEIEQALTDEMALLSAQPAMQIVGSRQAASLNRLNALLPELLNPEASTPTQERVNHAAIRARLHDLGADIQAHIGAQQARFSGYLRWLVVGMTLGALIMVNVAILVLVHTAQVVLKPVGQLVEGSRELAAEHFDHRVQVDQGDEFGELAQAYNRLAEQLQAIEERKAETLRQLAVTINHDLNNAMATIEMQLSLLDRESGRDKNLARYFRDIQSTLKRMSVRVASLKEIRRVVLTDYVDGQKMIDVEQSVAPAP
jgi:nitrate/nitrite-specific signal transduction histidine kinase